MSVNKKDLKVVSTTLKFSSLGGFIEWVTDKFRVLDETETLGRLQIGDAVNEDEAINLRQAKLLIQGAAVITAGFDGATGPGTGTQTGQLKICNVTGGSYTEGDITIWDGSTWDSFSLSDGQYVSFAVDVTMASNFIIGGSGATTFQQNAVYLYDVTGQYYYSPSILDYVQIGDNWKIDGSGTTLNIQKANGGSWDDVMQFDGTDITMLQDLDIGANSLAATDANLTGTLDVPNILATDILQIDIDSTFRLTNDPSGTLALQQDTGGGFVNIATFTNTLATFVGGVTIAGGDLNMSSNSIVNVDNIAAASVTTDTISDHTTGSLTLSTLLISTEKWKVYLVGDDLHVQRWGGISFETVIVIPFSSENSMFVYNDLDMGGNDITNVNLPGISMTDELVAIDGTSTGLKASSSRFADNTGVLDIKLSEDTILQGNSSNLAEEVAVNDLAIVSATFADESNWTNNALPIGTGSGEVESDFVGQLSYVTDDLGTYFKVEATGTTGFWKRIYIHSDIVAGQTKSDALIAELTSSAGWNNRQKTATYGDKGMTYSFGEYKYYCVDGSTHTWERELNYDSIIEGAALPTGSTLVHPISGGLSGFLEAGDTEYDNNTYACLICAIIDNSNALENANEVDISLPGAVNTSTDVITKTAHGFPEDSIVNLSGSNLPAPLTTGTSYFVINVTANTFQLSSDGTSAIDLTSAGSGTLTVRLGDVITFDETGHSSGLDYVVIGNKKIYADGDIVTFHAVSPGALPTGLDGNTVYYVIDFTDLGGGSTYFRVSLTPGGSAVSFTGDGTAVLTASSKFVLLRPTSVDTNFAVYYKT